MLAAIALVLGSFMRSVIYGVSLGLIVGLVMG